MGYLRVEDTVTVDFKLPHKGTSVLTEVMEDFYYPSVFQYLLKAFLKRINLSKIENEAM